MTPLRHAAVERLGDWNVVVTVRSGQFAHARTLLAHLGMVHRTRFYNVLAMKVDSGRDLLEVLHTRAAADRQAVAPLVRVVPLGRMFEFSSPEEFDERAGEAVLECTDQVAGRSFHVRMHRRGLKGRLISPEQERRLGGLILEATTRSGRPARLEFDDPDAIVVVETVGRQGGVSLWTREDIARYPWLRAD